MPAVVRIKLHLESDTLHLPELKEMVGRDLEIVVSEITPTPEPNDRYPLRGSVLRYDGPLEPVAEGEWETLS